MAYRYPPIPEGHLKVLLTLSSQHKDYFMSSDCPYPKSIATELHRRLQGSAPGPTPTSDVFQDMEDHVGDLEDPIELSSQSDRLYRELQIMGQNMNAETSAAEKNTYFKLSVTLLEKLLDVQEKAANMVKFINFRDLAIKIIGDEIPVDARTQIMTRLRDSLK